MLNNQDFAQSGPKCLGQSKSGQVLAFPRKPAKSQTNREPYQKARKLLLETIAKIDGAYAPATIRAYRSNFEFFINYCEKHHLDALPCQPSTLAGYIFYLSNQNLKSASIRLAAVSVAAIHRFNRMNDPSKDPDVILELRRMFRKLGRHQKQAAALNKENLDKLIDVTDQTLKGHRDRALLLTAYESLCRRSELAALRIEDIKQSKNDQGAQIRLRKSKTDQSGDGRWLTLSEETYQAITHWLIKANLTSGFLFRGITKYDTPTRKLEGAQINRIYKQLALKAGLDFQLVKNISGHSLRIGSAQDLLTSGASMPQIMNRGRWTKVDTVMRYIENSDLSNTNPIKN
jgi:site-specific recombinase XerD